MMKFGYLFALGATGVFALPQLGGQGAPQSVEQALEQTIATLEALGELRADIEAGAPDAVERIRRATEAPALEPRERDELLVRLRGEVAELHAQVDAGDRQPVGRALRPYVDPRPKPDDEQGAETLATVNAPSAAMPTVGLDDELRRTIASLPIPLEKVSATASRDPGLARTLEPEGYSADVLRQGRLFFRAGRYVEAMTLLERISQRSPEARYLLARSLERLGQQEEALAAYRELAELTDDPATARRARHDLEFLAWKRDFLQKRQGDK